VINDAKCFGQLGEAIATKPNAHLNVDEYSAKISSKNQLEHIKIPTLFLNSLDDPIFDNATTAIPFEQFTKNDYIMLATTRGGGHLGFLHGIVKIEQWFTKPAFEYFNYFSK